MIIWSSFLVLREEPELYQNYPKQGKDRGKHFVTGGNYGGKGENVQVEMKCKKPMCPKKITNSNKSDRKCDSELICEVYPYKVKRLQSRDSMVQATRLTANVNCICPKKEKK